MSPGRALADDARDPVDELDRLDAALEDGEERALVALVHRVLAGDEPDVRRGPREPLALDLARPAKIAIPAISSAGHHAAKVQCDRRSRRAL